MPHYLVGLAIMCDSINASTKAVSSQYWLCTSSVRHLQRLVVKEEVRRLRAILHSHQVLVKVLTIARDGEYLRA